MDVSPPQQQLQFFKKHKPSSFPRGIPCPEADPRDMYCPTASSNYRGSHLPNISTVPGAILPIIFLSKISNCKRAFIAQHVGLEFLARSYAS